MTQPYAFRILINGIVQGVGFRPFIYRTAHENSLSGWVKNTSYEADEAIIGKFEQTPPGRLLLSTGLGSTRIVDVLAGELLPRIC